MLKYICHHQLLRLLPSNKLNYLKKNPENIRIIVRLLTQQCHFYQEDKVKKHDFKYTRAELLNIYKKYHKEWNKIVLLLGYNGRGYLGMQRNETSNTIEDKLLMALLKSNVISQEEYENPPCMKFQRVSRTDKGVSAVRQVISMRCGLPMLEDMVAKINLNLPREIRLFGYKTVTQQFDSKKDCDSRTYSYILPTFAFAPVEELTTQSYRISDSVLNFIREVLQEFIGHQKFHNFTSGKFSSDPSCKRIILDIQCSQPFVRENLELVEIAIKGESFMLHQIRKMIGLTIALARGVMSIDLLNKCWEPTRVHIPLAPSNGLFLEETHFNWYNKTFAGNGKYEQLLWDELQEQVTSFKEKNIISPIVATEIKEQSMFKWLERLLLHVYDAAPSEDEERNCSVIGCLAHYVNGPDVNTKSR